MKTITKQDIAAIKKCTDLYFRLCGAKSTVECWNRPTATECEKDPFVRDICHSFEIETRISDYSKNRTGSTKYEGFASQKNNGSEIGEGSCKILGYILKEGFAIRAEWVCNNTSEKMIKEGKVNTFLRLIIYNKSGKYIGGFRFEEATSEYDLNRICYPIN